MEQLTKGQMMREYNAKLSRIVPGLSEHQVKDIMGEPSAHVTPDEAASPGSFFREIGSMFVFRDVPADAIWAFVNPFRPRIRHYVGFKDGLVCATWKETLTTQRAAELGRNT